MFRKSREKIYVFFNIQTSLNDYVLTEIVSYFINNNYQVTTILLNIREIYKEYSNENISQIVVDVIYEFQTKSELDVFVLNNVDNNNITVYYILNKLELYDIHEKEHYRLRCLDYIINFTVQNFIFNQNLKK